MRTAQKSPRFLEEPVCRLARPSTSQRHSLPGFVAPHRFPIHKRDINAHEVRDIPLSTLLSLCIVITICSLTWRFQRRAQENQQVLRIIFRGQIAGPTIDRSTGCAREMRNARLERKHAPGGYQNEGHDHKAFNAH